MLAPKLSTQSIISWMCAKVSLYKVAQTQQRDFCWIHSFKSFVENLGLCGVYFYYMSEYPFNKYYMCF